MFWAAILLVTLPVLPIYIWPELGNDLPSGWDEFAERGRQLISGWRVPLVNSDSEAEVKAPAMTSRGLKQDEVKSLEEAAQDLTARIARNPQEPSLRNQVGLIYAELGEYHNAIEHFKRSIVLCRSKIASLCLNERVLRANGKLTEASQVLLNQSQINLELSAAHSTLARVYEKLGQHDLVLAQLDQLNRDVAFGSDFKSGAPAIKIAESDRSDVQDYTDGSHRLFPQAIASLAKAQALMQARRISDAMAEFRRVIAIDPQAATAHQQLGIAAMVTGNTWLATEELKIAVNLDPSDALTRNNLGLAYQAQGKMHEARDQFIKVLELKPDNVEALLNLGSIYASLGQNGQAQETFERALRKDPRCAVAHNHLAALLSLSGNYGQAIAEFEEALTLAPHMASSHYGIGCALLNSRDYIRAIQEFRKALALDPRLTDAHNKIEVAYRKAGLASANSPGLN